MSVTPHDGAVGAIGLGVMGENLPLNIADHGYRVAVWTHTEVEVQPGTTGRERARIPIRARIGPTPGSCTRAGAA